MGGDTRETIFNAAITVCVIAAIFESYSIYFLGYLALAGVLWFIKSKTS
jgi:hypothetical protein